MSLTVNKRKIMILASWYPSALSPIDGIFIQDQAVILSQQYDVVVLVPQLISLRKILKNRFSTKKCDEARSGLKVFREYVFKPIGYRLIPIMYYWSYAICTWMGFKRVIKIWGKPDLIHAHVVLPGGWAAAILGKFYNVPVILTEHSGPFSIHLKNKTQKYLVNVTLKMISHLICVSPALLKQVKSLYPIDKYSIVGNLIKTRFFMPDDIEKTKSYTHIHRFLSIALLTEIKGMNYLIEAASHLVHRGLQSFQIIIGGDGLERPKLELLVQTLGLSAYFCFLGILSPSEVRDWMQKCDTFILPSIYESFGIVLGEAMSCGKPVISTYCGGPEFVVTPESGVLVDHSNPIALADIMAKLMLYEKEFSPRSIRQSVQKRFGEEAFLHNISKVYEGVLERGKGTPSSDHISNLSL